MKAGEAAELNNGSSDDLADYLVEYFGGIDAALDGLNELEDMDEQENV